MATYAVKEIFYTLQGEGANAGRPAVFCRFAGCNLWSGREEDRAKAECRFCDTDFVGTNGANGGKYATAEGLAAACVAARGFEGPGLIVITGGEPALQLDEPLIRELQSRGFEVAIETNGTIAVSDLIDWVCVSPKAGTTLVQRAGHELKLVYPQAELPPEAVADLPFAVRFLQPMDGPDKDANTRAAIAYCKANPKWRLSVQTHKVLGIP